MNTDCRRWPMVLSALALMGLMGCSGDLGPLTTSVVPTPPDVLAPEGPKETEAASNIPSTEETAPAGDTSAETANLETVSAKEFQSRIAKNRDNIKYTVVDGWATYCPPCLENFPHLVEMHEKYAEKGLRVISVSFDDSSSPNDVKAAGEFLKSKKADFENYIFSDGLGETYEHFDVNAIPAVFVYGADGQEIKRFTLDDPDNQFTYDEVEAYLKGLLSGGKAEK